MSLYTAPSVSTDLGEFDALFQANGIPIESVRQKRHSGIVSEQIKRSLYNIYLLFHVEDHTAINYIQ